RGPEDPQARRTGHVREASRARRRALMPRTGWAASGAVVVAVAAAGTRAMGAPNGWTGALAGLGLGLAGALVLGRGNRAGAVAMLAAVALVAIRVALEPVDRPVPIAEIGGGSAD